MNKTPPSLWDRGRGGSRNPARTKFHKVHRSFLSTPDSHSKLLAASRETTRRGVILAILAQNEVASQSATITSQTEKIEELSTEMEKLRKLLSQFVNGHRSEKRILPTAEQGWLPFESSEEVQAARAEAEAQAEAIVQTYTVTRTVTKKKRDKSLPSHLPRVEKVIEGNDTQTNCPTHGPRKPIGYDTTETLVYKPPELYVLVRKYPKPDWA